MRRHFLLLLLLSVVSSPPAKPDALHTLASDFWAWRAHYRPFSFDDIPCVERQGGPRDWSAAAITKQRADLAESQAGPSRAC